MRSSRCLFVVFFAAFATLICMQFFIQARLASGGLVISRFPARVRSSWDYRRTFYLEVHEFDRREYSQTSWVDSLHAVIVEMDTLLGLPCFRYVSRLFSGGDVFFNTQWYAQSETSLVEVAYFSPTHSGPPWKSPGELRFRFGDRSFESVDQFRHYLYQFRISGFARASSDTGFWKPPKKLFVFPMTVGATWVSMGEPWKEERGVTAEEKISVPAGDFLTLRIDIRPDIGGVNLKLYEWLSEQGVIKDSLEFGPTPLLDEFGQVYGYLVGYDRYELVTPAKSAVEEGESGSKKPVCVSLAQNYPNPFNPATSIVYTIGSRQASAVQGPIHTTLRIYNVMGQGVRTLVDEMMQPGSHEVVWDGRDSRGRQVSSGVYFCRLEAGGATDCKRMLLLK
jgi:hypothetical protein